jgi:hypothetical protein
MNPPNAVEEEEEEMYHVVKDSKGSLEVLPPAGRIRKRGDERRAAPAPKVIEEKAYRVHFSVSDRGRYFRKTKRVIRW